MVARYVAPIIGQSSASPIPCTLPNPANAGDLLFLLAYQNTAGVASATGLTATYGARTIGAGVHRATPLQAAATGSTGAAISVAVSASPTTTYAVGAEFSGVTATEDVAAAFAASAGTGTTIGTGSLSTTGVDVLLLAWLATQTAVAAAATIDSGFTIITSSARASLAYKYVSAAGSQTATWTYLSTAAATGGIHAFRLATGIPRGDLAGFIG